MDWDEIRVFLAVASAQQLQGAAKTLGVDRTTVGRRLVALEARLGTPLFHRTRDALRLTVAGERALARARRMESEARALISETTAADAATGLVRVAVTEALAPFLIERGLLSVCDEHPGLRVEILAGNRRLDLSLGEAEIALRVDPVRGAHLRARCVVRSSIALYASRSYVERRGAPRTPAQLAGHDALIPSGELSHLPEARWLLAQRGVTAGFASNSFAALIAAAKGGQGILALTAYWGDTESKLVRLFAVPGIPPRAIWLVSTLASAKVAACKVVMRRLVDLLGDHPGGASARARVRSA